MKELCKLIDLGLERSQVCDRAVSIFSVIHMGEVSDTPPPGDGKPYHNREIPVTW